MGEVKLVSYGSGPEPSSLTYSKSYKTVAGESLIFDDVNTSSRELGARLSHALRWPCSPHPVPRPLAPLCLCDPGPRGSNPYSTGRCPIPTITSGHDLPCLRNDVRGSV